MAFGRFLAGKLQERNPETHHLGPPGGLQEDRRRSITTPNPSPVERVPTLRSTKGRREFWGICLVSVCRARLAAAQLICGDTPKSPPLHTPKTAICSPSPTTVHQNTKEHEGHFHDGEKKLLKQPSWKNHELNVDSWVC